MIESKQTKSSLGEEINFYGNEFDSKEIYTSALEVLELAKDSKSLWKQMRTNEKRSLMKKVCLNQRLDASIEFNLKKSFQILSKIKNLTGFAKWCPWAGLEPARSKPIAGFKSCASTNSATRAWCPFIFFGRKKRKCQGYHRRNNDIKTKDRLNIELSTLSVN